MFLYGMFFNSFAYNLLILRTLSGGNQAKMGPGVNPKVAKFPDYRKR